MVRAFMIAAASIAVLASSSMAFSQQRGQFGNADEAKAMLAKTVTAVKADKAKALDMIAKGEGGFLDRDLYPFCSLRVNRTCSTISSGGPLILQ